MNPLQIFIENISNICLDQNQYAYFFTILCASTDKSDFKIDSVLKKLFGEIQITTANEPFEQLMKYGFIFRADTNYYAVNPFSVSDSTRFMFDPEKFLYVQAARLHQAVQQLKQNQKQQPQGDYICKSCQSQFSLRQIIRQKDKSVCDECGHKALQKVKKQIQEYSLVDVLEKLLQNALSLVNTCSEDIEQIKTQYLSIRGDYREKLDLLTSNEQYNNQIIDKTENKLNIAEIFNYKKQTISQEARFQKTRLLEKQFGRDVKSIYRGKVFHQFAAKRLYIQKTSKPLWFESVGIRAQKLIKGEQIQ